MPLKLPRPSAATSRKAWATRSRSPMPTARLVGSQVVSAPSFQENLLSFGVSYGLALAGTGQGRHSHESPAQEIIYDRLVKAERNLGRWRPPPCSCWGAASATPPTPWRWALSIRAGGKPPKPMPTLSINNARNVKGDAEKATSDFQATDQIGQKPGKECGRARALVGASQGHERVHAETEAPGRRRKAQGFGGLHLPVAKNSHVTNVECQYLDDVSQWYAKVKPWYHPISGAGRTAYPPAAPGAPPARPARGRLSRCRPPGRNGKCCRSGDRPHRAGVGSSRLSAYHYHKRRSFSRKARNTSATR